VQISDDVLVRNPVKKVSKFRAMLFPYYYLLEYINSLRPNW